ncbi:nucleotidyltransferase [Metabacillus fastidiosus]|uniref:nucleotidyltransferase n=1 Tax=Metabacillus fastidiosus TaxID=1458 RepID=UPI003D2727D2
MNAVGIVVEYNPFHNGHQYHLERSKEVTNADIVIAVMSGNFLQRGEPALVSKWERTKMALHGGCDLVIELPYVFATQKAENFANGAISILHALKCNSLCFGSEHGEINSFQQTYEFLKKHEEQYNYYIKKFMKEGYSYPRALTLSFQQLEKDSELLDLSQPNNILGYHYVKAINEQKTNIAPFTVKRAAAGYHDTSFSSSNIASATSIRKALFHHNENPIINVVPPFTYASLQNTSTQQWEHYFSLLKYAIMTMSTEELAKIYEMEEGLENRISAAIVESESFQQLMEKLKTKRYTWTRLQRLCTHILTKVKKEEIKKATLTGKAEYIRLLGMSENGRRYLKNIKKDLPIPLIAKVSAFSHPGLTIDIKAAHTYNQIFPEPLRSHLLKAEFSTPPIMY